MNDVKILELSNSIQRLRGLASKAIREDFVLTDGWLWVQDIFVDHPVLGNSIIVEYSGDLSSYAVTYEENEDGSLTLAMVQDWRRVNLTYSYADVTIETVEMAESFQELNSITISEADAENEDKFSSIVLDVLLVKEGFGNPRDNHYYGREQLARDAHLFNGVKMYTTNHKGTETNERNEVAIIGESAYSVEKGGIMSKVIVFDPMFARKVRNREERGILESLHCSIKCDGTSFVKPHIVSGRSGKLVKEFTEVHTVDFVSQAGAGGKALARIS